MNHLQALHPCRFLVLLTSNSKIVGIYWFSATDEQICSRQEGSHHQELEMGHGQRVASIYWKCPMIFQMFGFRCDLEGLNQVASRGDWGFVLAFRVSSGERSRSTRNRTACMLWQKMMQPLGVAAGSSTGGCHCLAVPRIIRFHRSNLAQHHHPMRKAPLFWAMSWTKPNEVFKNDFADRLQQCVHVSRRKW